MGQDFYARVEAKKYTDRMRRERMGPPLYRGFVGLQSESEAKKVAQVAFSKVGICVGCAEASAVPVGTTRLWKPTLKTINECGLGRRNHIRANEENWFWTLVERLLHYWRGAAANFFVADDPSVWASGGWQVEFFLTQAERDTWVAASPQRRVVEYGTDGLYSRGSREFA